MRGHLLHHHRSQPRLGPSRRTRGCWQEQALPPWSHPAQAAAGQAGASTGGRSPAFACPERQAVRLLWAGAAQGHGLARRPQFARCQVIYAAVELPCSNADELGRTPRAGNSRPQMPVCQPGREGTPAALRLWASAGRSAVAAPQSGSVPRGMLRRSAAGKLLSFPVPACGQVRHAGLAACLLSLQEDLNHRTREMVFELVGAAAAPDGAAFVLACASAQV